MSTLTFLRTPAAEPTATLLLAHGSGAPMDTRFMTEVAEGLATRGVSVLRFEFDYMADRRTGGAKRPPPDMAILEEEFRTALAEVDVDGPLLIGGKSMGGRVATLIADEAFESSRIAGVLCLGYPFHPPGKPDNLRTAHLVGLRTPALICQGTRDPFGTPRDVAGYGLSDAIRLHWLEDGDHDLAPRVTVTGLRQSDHLAEVCEVVAQWCAGMVKAGTV
ncbi:putative hydrolase protein [Roseivivax marinus]|uniref:Putative hydrolase protein n=1 Tax=Roseivivax marinus TaxID=1379903 RepID=W4HFH4_9RHOB|nr:alpha/beta family hydrolase [Roseivivax marinus]ETW11153.1 putative hydrolase protein [Roseivivax marinus]